MTSSSVKKLICSKIWQNEWQNKERDIEIEIKKNVTIKLLLYLHPMKNYFTSRWNNFNLQMWNNFNLQIFTRAPLT